MRASPRADALVHGCGAVHHDMLRDVVSQEDRRAVTCPGNPCPVAQSIACAERRPHIRTVAVPRASRVRGNQMENPYFQLHRRFRDAGAEVLLSSGQACVAFGIAAFSKDGDWIIREDAASCRAVLGVLKEERATYRLGAPLDPEWLRLGLTTHFEYITGEGLRMRADFCSRPPRVSDLSRMWVSAVQSEGLDVVDVETLIRLKQTRRQRDYPVIGALAQVAGLEERVPHIALNYLQDYDLLRSAVLQWPREAGSTGREAVRLLVAGASRREVVIALALEQDELVRRDHERVRALEARAGDYPERFMRLRARWRRNRVSLLRQHEQLREVASCLLTPS